LTSIALPSTVTTIGDYAFEYCLGLTSIVLPSSLTAIGGSVFFNCSELTSVIIPSSITSIGSSVFCGCSGLTSINIPSSVVSIGYNAFTDCTGLTSLIIPSSVTTIGSSAFEGCKSLTSVIIPSSVTSIGSYAFGGCSGLKAIKVLSTVPINLTASGVFSDVNMNTCILQVPIGTKSAYQAATQWKDFKCIVEGAYSSTKTINVSAGKLLSTLKSTELFTVNNLTVTGTIDARDFVVLRDSMINLSTLDLNGVDIVAYTGIGGTVGATYTKYPAKAIPQIAFCKQKNLGFGGKASLISVIIPSSVTSIGSYAFGNCIGLTSITIPSSVDSISSYAFGYCKGLTSVTIANSVTSIGDGAFEDCIGLTSITIPSHITSIGDGAFDYCSGLTTISADINNANYSSTDGVLFNKNKTTIICCPGGKQAAYAIPSSVTSIGDGAFEYCIGLTSITIPSSVTLIGNGAFAVCRGLTSITIPGSVTSIGNYAFSGCSGLTSITIPGSVTSIESEAFYQCTGLTSIIIPNSVTLIGSEAFELCTSLTSVTIPNSVTSIGSEAFENCNRLYSVTIPSSVTSIGSYAFYGCTGLISIYAYPTTPVDLSPSSSVFGYVKSTCTLYVPAGTKRAYQSAIQWKDFTNIVEMDITAAPIVTNESISLYPNPVTDGFIVSGFDGTALLKITDINGRIMLLKKIVNAESVSMSNLPKGLYIVKLLTGDSTVERKVIKR
jgi:hypothetical protein